MASGKKGCVLTSVVVILGILDRYRTLAADIRINLAGDGCDRPDGYYIGDDDTANIYHRGSFDFIATRDDCTVSLRTDPGRRLRFKIGDANFRQCGVTIYIYDALNTNTDPKEIVTCNSDNKNFVEKITNFNVMRLVLRKLNVDTDNFDFLMRVTNDRGPSIDFRSIDGDQQEPLDPGIIVGIAIAGVIIIIALVLLAIYLCIRGRSQYSKDEENASRADSNVYTSGNSGVLFANKRYSHKKYGSTEDVRSTTSSQEKANGAYSNTAYTSHPLEKKSDRSNSIGRAKGKTGFTNDNFQDDESDMRYGDRHWDEEDADYEVRIGSFRKSRIDSFKSDKKQLKSAMKKPTDIEMSKVNQQPINSILKKNRTKSPNRSQTSSTEGSVDVNAIMYGYSRSGAANPNIKHKPVIERRRSRSRSGTRSNRSASSSGMSNNRRAHSAERKHKPTPANSSRMYSDVFIAEDRPRSSSRSRARSNSLRSRSHRGSDSVDSESSATSSKRVSMNPGGKHVKIKGEETDI